MIFDFGRNKNIRIALSQQHHDHDRITAIQALTAHPKSLRALEQITQETQHIAFWAFHVLGYLDDPGALRVILRAIVRDSISDNGRFRDALTAAGASRSVLPIIADESSPALLQAGMNVLAWKRERLEDRNNQQYYLWSVKWLLEQTGTTAQPAIVELDRLLRLQLTQELSRLQNIASKSNAFEEAEAAIGEIVSLRTPAARAALVLIRRQPSRELLHSYLAQDPDVETGGSSIGVKVHRSSTDLGKTLKGDDRSFWDAAGNPGNARY